MSYLLKVQEHDRPLVAESLVELVEIVECVMDAGDLIEWARRLDGTAFEVGEICRLVGVACTRNGWGTI